MANKRITDQTTDTALSAGDYIIVDSSAEGTRKFDLGTELTEIKEDLSNIDTSGVPSTVRQALKTLLESAAYADTGLTDEMAVISSWASQVTAITLNQSSISISGATTSQLTATTTPSGGTVTWSSSDTSVATVSSNGLVTGVSNGTAIITATSGDVSATCTVTVSGIATLSSISAAYTQTGTIYETDDLDDILTAGTLVVTATYSDSSTSTVASTDYTLSGTLAVGTSTITVSYSGKTTTFNVTVSAPMYSFANGSHTFSDGTSGTTTNGTSITVTNGNHVLVESTTAGKTAFHANLSNVSANSSTANTADNYLNGGETYFTLHNGETLLAKVTVDSLIQNDTNAKWVMVVRDKSKGSVLNVIGQDYYWKNTTVGQVFQASYTATEDIDVACFSMYSGYRNNSNALSMEFTVEAYIDGTRVI